jgi:hypothetical protein
MQVPPAWACSARLDLTPRSWRAGTRVHPRRTRVPEPPRRAQCGNCETGTFTNFTRKCLRRLSPTSLRSRSSRSPLSQRGIGRTGFWSMTLTRCPRMTRCRMTFCPAHRTPAAPLASGRSRRRPRESTGFRRAAVASSRALFRAWDVDESFTHRRLDRHGSCEDLRADCVHSSPDGVSRHHREARRVRTRQPGS